MEQTLLTGEQGLPALALEAAVGTALVSAAASVPFQVTAHRCEASPPDDTSSQWSFSGYCKAFHAIHLFNYPDTVSGGGILEGVFALPIVITIAGVGVALHARRKLALRSALAVSGALVTILTILSLTLASARFHAF